MSKNTTLCTLKRAGVLFPKMEYVETRPTKSRRRRMRWAKYLIVTVIFLSLICLFRYGTWFLVHPDPLPQHLDAAVVLQGSIMGENARVAGAVRLLQAGTAGELVLSVPHESYWGLSSEPAARQYIANTYGSEITGRLTFCETGPDVNSTEEEAETVSGCLRQHGWRTIVVVTSDYHTRRAGLIWKHVMRQQAPDTKVWIHGVDDPEFDAKNWWRKRTYAKTVYLESTKLLWTVLTVWK